MKNNKNEPLKLNICFELAYEIIYYSIFVILIGLAFIFASNLLTFNWYSVIFGLLAILLIILKTKSFLLIEEGTLSIYYLKYLHKAQIEMKTIDEFIFYERERRVEVRSNKKTILVLYLKDKNKKRLLDWLVQHYPNIPCLFFNENEING